MRILRTQPVTLLAIATGLLVLSAPPAAIAQTSVRQSNTTKIDLGGLVPRFNGTWRVTRSVGPDCPIEFAQFAIRITNGVVSANGGNGSVTGTGQLKFPGRDNFFRGRLNSNGTGNGTYSGRCTGTFTAIQSKP
jgi:hypothetical protein